MKGNTIVVRSTSDIRRQGYIKTGQTIKPGTVCEIDYSTDEVLGLPTLQIYARGTDGKRPRGPLCILYEDFLQGKAYDASYAAGDLASYIIPQEGDEFNMFIADVAGTGDTKTKGDVLMVDDGTGKLIATTGSPESTPFVLIETLGVLTADTLGHCQFGGF